MEKAYQTNTPISMDDIFLADFFSQDRGHTSDTSFASGYFLLDEEDDSFLKALEALQSVCDVLVDSTDTELDLSTSSNQYDNVSEYPSIEASSTSTSLCVPIANIIPNTPIIPIIPNIPINNSSRKRGTDAILDVASRNASLQRKMNGDLITQLGKINIANPCTRIFEGVEHTSIILESQLRIPPKFTQLSSNYYTMDSSTLGHAAMTNKRCEEHGGGARCDTTGCTRSVVLKSKYCRVHVLCVDATSADDPSGTDTVSIGSATVGI